jgi:hypothetical protein
MPSDEHLAVMQSLEMNLANFYSEQPQLTDYDVSDAFDALVRYYKARSHIIMYGCHPRETPSQTY